MFQIAMRFAIAIQLRNCGLHKEAGQEKRVRAPDDAPLTGATIQALWNEMFDPDNASRAFNILAKLF